MDPEGSLAGAVPDGYEIYENIRGQVFLRRRMPQVMTSEELSMVESALSGRPKGNFYRFEAQKNTIVIYEAEDKTEHYMSIAMPWVSKERLRESAEQSAYYQAVTRFVLTDAARRLFSAERFCFRGSVEDWIPLGAPAAPLHDHLNKFIKHLGRESFFELY
jgi:hypothetical protein